MARRLRRGGSARRRRAFALKHGAADGLQIGRVEKLSIGELMADVQWNAGFVAKLICVAVTDAAEHMETLLVGVTLQPRNDAGAFNSFTR